jgi:hypothetical protein
MFIFWFPKKNHGVLHEPVNDIRNSILENGIEMTSFNQLEKYLDLQDKLLINKTYRII